MSPTRIRSLEKHVVVPKVPRTRPGHLRPPARPLPSAPHPTHGAQASRAENAMRSENTRA